MGYLACNIKAEYPKRYIQVLIFQASTPILEYSPTSLILIKYHRCSLQCRYAITYKNGLFLLELFIILAFVIDKIS